VQEAGASTGGPGQVLRGELGPVHGSPWIAIASRAPVSAGCLPGDEQPTQNWHGQGESDCLIKTKHCDGQRVVLTQCDFCPVL
jgi:hypothetical protein